MSKVRFDTYDFTRASAVELLKLQRDVLRSELDQMSWEADDLSTELCALLRLFGKVDPPWTALAVLIVHAKEDLSDCLWSDDWKVEDLKEALEDLTELGFLPRTRTCRKIVKDQKRIEKKLTKQNVVTDYINYCNGFTE